MKQSKSRSTSLVHFVRANCVFGPAWHGLSLIGYVWVVGVAVGGHDITRRAGQTGHAWPGHAERSIWPSIPSVHINAKTHQAMI